MRQKKTIYKRKIRAGVTKILGYFALFIITFAICMGLFYILRPSDRIVSPVELSGHIASASSFDAKEQIASLCQKHGLTCKNIMVHTDKTATFNISDNGNVILSLGKNLDSQIASLQLTIAQLTIEGKRFSRLDFRFDRPTITF